MATLTLSKRRVIAALLVVVGIGLFGVAGWAGVFSPAPRGSLITVVAVAAGLVGLGFLAIAAALFWMPTVAAEPPDADASDRARESRFSPWRAATTSLVTALAGTLAFLTITGWVISSLDHHLQLPLLIVVLLIGLLSAIAFMVISFGIFRLVNPTQALGLPPGSVQAIIALSLILLFVTLTVFLVLQMKNRQPTDPAVDVAKQVLTVLGTLVTAVSAFYFGSRSTTDAVRATPAGGGGAQSGMPSGGQQPGGAGSAGAAGGGQQAGGAGATGVTRGGQRLGGAGTSGTLATGATGGIQPTSGAGGHDAEG